MGGLRIGLVANLDKPRALMLSCELLGWLGERGVETLVAPELAAVLSAKADRAGLVLSVEEMAARVDFLLVLGGDGTLLATAKRVVGPGADHGADRGSTGSIVPILGVNLGHLGFLTEIEEANVYRDLPAFLAGRYVVDERVLLRCTVLPSGDEYLALNEAVVSKGPPARTLRLWTRVGDALLNAFAGDGVIVSTPTGSTAYALAAGGPVLNPGLAALVITPICPHSFHSRPTVLAPHECVTIETEPETATATGRSPEPRPDPPREPDREPAPTGMQVSRSGSGAPRVVRPSSEADGRSTVLTLDGQQSRLLAPGDRVQVRLSDRVARLMRRPGWSFYEVVRHKLSEGDAADGLPTAARVPSAAVATEADPSRDPRRKRGPGRKEEPS